MDKDFKEIYSRDILNEVKKIVSRNNIKISGYKEKETDEKILEIINDLCVKENEDKNKESFNLKVLDSFENDKNRIITVLVLYYVAIYFDNMNLFKFLIENNFDFKYNTIHNGFNLFVLDSRISSNFNFREYFDLLKDNLEVFRNFYNSLKIENGISNEDAIEKFVRIIKNNPNIAKLNNSSIFNVAEDFLNKEVLSRFKEETIVNLNDEQKSIINHKFSYPNMYKQEKDIIQDLIENYNYSHDLVYWQEFLRDFDLKEILNFDKNKVNVIRAIYSNMRLPYDVPDEMVSNAVESLKEIYSIKPDYNYRFEALVYDVLSVDELLKLSEEGFNDINGVIAKQVLFWDKYNFSLKTLRAAIRYQYNRDRRRNFVKKLVKGN